MGILFNKKSGSGAMVNRRLIKDHDLTKRDIRSVTKQVSFAKGSAQRKFKDMLTHAQHGGLTREEVHEGLHEMIEGGYIRGHKAIEVARELGLNRKDLRRFEGRSESLSNNSVQRPSMPGNGVIRPSVPSVLRRERPRSAPPPSFRNTPRP